MAFKNGNPVPKDLGLKLHFFIRIITLPLAFLNSVRTLIQSDWSFFPDDTIVALRLFYAIFVLVFVILIQLGLSRYRKYGLYSVLFYFWMTALYYSGFSTYGYKEFIESLNLTGNLYIYARQFSDAIKVTVICTYVFVALIMTLYYFRRRGLFDRIPKRPKKKKYRIKFDKKDLPQKMSRKELREYRKRRLAEIEEENKRAEKALAEDAEIEINQ